MSHAIVATLLATALAAPVAPAAEPAAEPTPVVPAAGPAPEAAPVAPAAEPTPSPEAPPVSAPTPVSTPEAAAPAEPAPSTATSVPATRPVELQPEPEPVYEDDPDLRRREHQAQNLVVTGAVGVGLGVGTLLLVSWPLHGMYRNSLEEAEDERWVTSQAEPIADALYRRRLSLISAGVGAGLTAVGAVILGVGLSRRARLRRPADTLSLAPAVGGGHFGVAASMRF